MGSAKYPPSPPLSPVLRANGVDEERDLDSRVSFESDPLLLRTKIEPDNMLRKRNQKALDAFYKKQNLQIESFLKPMDQHISDAEKDQDIHRSAIKFAIQASLVANLCLMVLGLYAAISSGSLSFFSVALDQVFDPWANIILNFCHRASERVDKSKWPSGGSRFETIGEIIYSFVMGSASVVLIAFSIQSLISHTPDTPPATLHIASVAAVATAFVVKLALFLYCFGLRNKNTQVRVLFQDHRNDVFVTAFGILTNVGGSSLVWYLDPLGAVLISLALIYLWGGTTISCLFSLAGRGITGEFTNLIIYNAMYFSDDIVAVDQVTCYSAGSKYDIVMDKDTPLSRSHDVAENLQNKLEELKNVERAYVHVDYETSHRAEHQKRL